jgi:UDPglucose 6-dehydrogenase
MSTINITNISEIEYEGFVYNMEVCPKHDIEDDQYYINADTGIVVHNCHPRDNIALRHLANELELGYDLFHTIMDARDKQAKNIALKLIKLSKEYNLPIIIHGRAYKPKVSYTDGSYSELIAHFIKAEGFEIKYCDPLTNDFVSDGTKAIILMAHNAGVTYYGTEIKYEENEWYFIPGEGSVFLDPWRKLPKLALYTVIHYGNTRNV